MPRQKKYGPYTDDNDDPIYQEVMTDGGVFGVPEGYSMTFDKEGAPQYKDEGLRRKSTPLVVSLPPTPSQPTPKTQKGPKAPPKQKA